MTGQILENFNKIKIEIEKNKGINITEAKCLSKKIIHSNPIYLCRLKNKDEIAIKFFEKINVMEKENFCNKYLEARGLCVPKIIFHGKYPTPYIAMKKIDGKKPLVSDVLTRVVDLTKVHTNSLDDPSLNKNLPKLTKKDRIKNLERNIELLRSNPLISDRLYDKFAFLKKLINLKDYGFWENCFCFNDFFINNSLKSNKGLYYFDFEKACISNPFIDVGCIIINYPEKYEDIKKEYIENIRVNLKSEKFKIRLSNLGLLVDIGMCEKVIEDAAFLSNDSIKKTKSSNFCKKLAKRKIESVSFVFENLKNNLMGEK